MAEDEPGFVRFQREFQVLANLDHPSLIQVMDLGVADGRLYYTTALRDARSLAEILEEEGPFEPSRALDLLLPVGEALELMHRQKIIHRGVSAHSIRVDLEGTRAYLATFELLKIMALPSLTEKGFQAPQAEAAYTPEDHQGEPATAQTDVFLFASVLYHALTGRRLPGPQEVLTGKVRHPFEIDPVSQHSATVPEGLDQCILEGLAEDPEVRPKDMARFLKALKKQKKAFEVQSLSRDIGLKTMATQAVKIQEVRDQAEEEKREAKAQARRLAEGDAGEAFQESSKQVLGELSKQFKLWLEESPRNRYKLGAGVLFAMGLSYGVGQLTQVDSTPALQQYQERKRRTRQAQAKKVSLGEMKTKLLSVAEAAVKEPTDQVNFENRWLVFRRFVKALPKKERNKEFPASVMANLRVAFYRDPGQAAKKLDEYLAQASEVAKKH